MRAPVLLVACAIALPVAGRAAAQAPEVQVSAVPEYAAVRAGSSFRVAVRLRIPEGWHIYWTNPGPGGLPTTVAWHLPGGVTAGETEWPFPRRTRAAVTSRMSTAAPSCCSPISRRAPTPRARSA